MKICPIVEGHGEVGAVPILLRRLRDEITPNKCLDVLPPIRIPRSKIVQEGQLERAIELAARQTGTHDGILVLMDADDDCPAELAPRLLQRARDERSDRRIVVILAKREFEAWFLAAASSIGGHRGLRNGLRPPANPEEVRNPKAWLRENMDRHSYRETLDQPALASVMDLEQARAAPSFAKLWREVEALLRQPERAGFE